jgi:S-DNA-T family DNA segregation ATPase FtsK/SpoIIIE
MLYMASDSSKLVRLQGCFVSDTELDRLVKFWKGLGQGPSDFSAIGGPQMVQQTLWPDWRARERMASTDDDLLDEAIEVAKQYKGVSISLLQRKLRIGYSRAARLMDLMEKRGLVGPAAAAGKPREVRLDEEEGDEDTF